MNEYKPDYVSPPGETINEMLESCEMDKEQFAGMIELEVDEVEKLLKGDLEIDCDLATRLQDVKNNHSLQVQKAIDAFESEKESVSASVSST